jgi:hypothetical protein
MMKINLHQLLSANISDEAAFHLVQFVRNLALALETSYFDQILHHQSRPEHHHSGCGSEENTDSPF